MIRETGIYLRRFQELALSEIERKRFGVMVCHRRFGKTFLSTALLVRNACTCKRGDTYHGAYIAPTYKQAKDVAWREFKKHAANTGAKYNESELKIEFQNGAIIRLYGAENPDSLRGLGLCDVVFDEVAQMPYAIWSEIVLPMLLANGGRALFIGTPQGMNALWQIWEKANRTADMWAALSFPVSRTNLLGPEELAIARAELSEREYDQEYECSFLASAENALISFGTIAEAAARKVWPEDVASQPTILGVDVGRTVDASCIVRRQGLLMYAPIVLKGMDNMLVADRVADEIRTHKPDAVFIDAGQGYGVIDRLRHLGFAVFDVNFGGKAVQDARYANRRAEMWFSLRDWLQSGGRIPDEQRLRQELAAPTYLFNPSGKRQLEPKEKIKERLGFSPDIADALALTFAAPVAAQVTGAIHRMAKVEYDLLGWGDAV